MISTISMLKAALGFLSSVFGLIRERKLMKAGGDAVLVDWLKNEQELAAKAIAARRTAERAFDANGLPISDPNRRD